MIRFGRFLLFALLALWLPATLHCKLEAAGVFADHCTDAGSPATDVGCTNDACPTIEDALFKDSAVKLTVAAPAECHLPDYCTLLLALDRPDETRPYFAQAYAKLSQDAWLTATEPARLERLKCLGEGQ